MSDETSKQEGERKESAQSEQKREKTLKEKSARLHELCHAIAEGLDPQQEIGARWEAYWIANALGWDQMHSGRDWLGAAEGKLWRYKTREPWQAFQEALAFSGSAPVLGTNPGDAEALLADDDSRARVMVTWAVPVLLSSPGELGYAALEGDASRAAIEAFAQAMGLGESGVAAGFAKLLDPRKLRRLEADRGGLRAFWSAMAMPNQASEAARELGEALGFEAPHADRWPALAWLVFGLWPKDAQSSHKLFTALAPRLGPGCASNMDDALEAASAVMRAALAADAEAKGLLPKKADAAQSAPNAAKPASREAAMDALARGLPEFAMFPPMPFGFAIQTQEAVEMTLPTAARLAARQMLQNGAQTVGWVAEEGAAESDETAWKKGAMWAMGAEGVSMLWNPSLWLSDLMGPDELGERWRSKIEAVVAEEGLRWRPPTRLKGSHAQAILGGSPESPAAAEGAPASGAPSGEKDPLAELGLLDPRAMALSGKLLRAQKRS
jgi:hypothetical protein